MGVVIIWEYGNNYFFEILSKKVRRKSVSEARKYGKNHDFSILFSFLLNGYLCTK